MAQMDVVGVRLEMPSNQPIVLLREVGADRYLPIWIGAPEATAIAFAQQGLDPPRPLSHDLMKSLLAAAGLSLSSVKITGLRDGVFYADLVLSSGAEVSARPSDAIALALRTGSPIFGDDQLLEEVGIVIPEEGDQTEDESEVERFREFLDTVTPEDFEK